ncbi:RPA49 polymerase, partial [Amia calva]|nr:RPA49 polymerase [Amia calva]
MAASSVWKYCEEEQAGKSALIVQFSNGQIKNTEQVDFTFYKNADTSNPRKKNRRIVAADTDRLCYVGNNYGAGSLKCNNLCKYYVGVLDKKTNRMEVHNAELFSMQPVLPGETLKEEGASEIQDKSYREKVDSLIEAFGTNKQKRALSSRRLNQVGSETLHKAVARAADNIIEKKGLKALVQDVVQTETQAENDLYLPPCNPGAETPADVYAFDSLISPAQYKALETPAQTLKGLSEEDIHKMTQEGSSLVVLKELQCLPKDPEAQDHKVRCLWYLNWLFKLSSQRRIGPKYGSEEGMPRNIMTSFLKNFTVETFNDGQIRNMVPASMKTKIVAYALALLLHIRDFEVDLTLLQRDFRLTENKMLEVAKAMGLKIGKISVLASGGLMEDHKLGTLVLPLMKYDQRMERRKRKKMS